LREAKSEELKKEISYIQESYDRIMKRKDASIQRLHDEINEQEDQYQKALSTHMNNLDTLMTIHNSRVDALESDYQRDLNELMKEFDDEW
jgi:hypothetical protein